MKSGLYICKCYHKNLSTGELYPVLKFGRAKNIDSRMYYYNQKAKAYKLICFFPCKEKELKEREGWFKELSSFSEELRYTCSEHIYFQSGYFKRMYNDLKYWSQVTWTIDKRGFLTFNEI
jgi:hypothetical protein